ncbi:hypothetical protein [Methanoregula sp.]|jgi:hypothetical protein|uniref:hypothetical protein n=1 Tax=Methanoregula sp. TaxID=2052170 RepID=UPI003C1BBA8E
MTDETTPTYLTNRIKGYFSPQELGIIIALAVIAFLTSSFGLSHLLPGGSAPGLVHAFLKLPGPGAGIFIASAFTCLWLVLGILITKKPGTVILMSVLIVLFSLALSLAKVGNVRLDYLALMVAIIIECAGLLPLEQKPWKFIFPSLLSIMGIITLALMLTNNAKMGENGAAANVFPLGYAVSGILAIALGVILWSYPSAKYIIGAGCAEVFYIVFSWAFNGKSGFFSWAPVAPAIPALITFAFVCGAFMAALAYGFYLLWTVYVQHGSAST